MVDLVGQYENIREEVNFAIQEVISTASFIKGPQLLQFQESLASYLSVEHVIGCANGTDALQIALMALGLEEGDEVILPCFTYVATAEVIALLRLKPVMVEVDPETFNITADIIEKAVTPKTRAIVPVHLFGQCADMEPIMAIARKHNLFVVEDAAQALGAVYTFSDGSRKHAGAIGDIGCTSFFPSKNLGCYGDGGALYTNNSELAITISKIANHGQCKKYHHEVVGVNSRLDTLQAAILNVKLKYLDKYELERNNAASHYDRKLGDLNWLDIPSRQKNSSHVFHQYTILLKSAEDRDALKYHLQQSGIPSMIYYPLPLHQQEAYLNPEVKDESFPVCTDLCRRVLSLPIHTEMPAEELEYITNAIISFKS